MEAEESIYNEERTDEDEPKPRPSIDESVVGEPVRRLVRLTPPVAVSPDAAVNEAVRLMKQHRVGCVLIQDGGRLIGILTERDILTKLVGTGADPALVKVDAVMTRKPETLGPDDPVAFALQLMSVGGFRHIPLVDGEGRPVAILSVKDIVDFLVEHFPQAVLNIPPEPGRHAKRPEGA
jgi:CBS domain-containing protein